MREFAQNFISPSLSEATAKIRKILVWVPIKDKQSLWIGESRNQNPLSVVRFYSLSLLYPYVPPICHSDRYFSFKLVQTRFLSNKNRFFALKFRKKFLVVVHWQINNKIFRWKTATQRTDSKSDYIPRQRKIQGKLKKRTVEQVRADMNHVSKYLSADLSAKGHLELVTWVVVNLYSDVRNWACCNWLKPQKRKINCSESFSDFDEWLTIVHQKPLIEKPNGF